MVSAVFFLALAMPAREATARATPNSREGQRHTMEAVQLTAPGLLRAIAEAAERAGVPGVPDKAGPFAPGPPSPPATTAQRARVSEEFEFPADQAAAERQQREANGRDDYVSEDKPGPSENTGP